MRKAEIHTEKGVMKVEFYDADAPNTVDNFIKLSKDGYYDCLLYTSPSPRDGATSRMPSSA